MRRANKATAKDNLDPFIGPLHSVLLTLTQVLSIVEDH